MCSPCLFAINIVDCVVGEYAETEEEQREGPQLVAFALQNET